MKKLLLVMLMVTLAVGVWAKGEQEKITLTHWDLHTIPTRLEAIENIMAAWPYDNIEIEMDHISNEGTQYKTKIQTSLAAGAAPDTFFMFSGFFIKPFIEAGKIMPLDDFIAKDNVYARTISGKGNFTHGVFGGKSYGLPESWTIAPIWCNKALFDEYGLKLPKTFDEAITAIKTFSANGIIPIALAGGGIWPPILIYEQLAIQHGGQGVLDDVANQSCKDPAFLKAAKDIKAMADAGAFPQAFAGLAYQEAEDLFARGRAAMYVMGGWAAGPLEQANSVGTENIVSIPFPSVSGGRGAPTDLWGGSTVLYSMSADTEFPEEAWKWLLYFSENYSNEVYRLGETPSVWKNDIKSANPLIQALEPIAASATSMTWGWDFAFPGEQASDYMDNLNLMLAGEITPEKFAASLPGAK